MGTVPLQIMNRFTEDTAIMSVVSMQSTVSPAISGAVDLSLYVVSSGIDESFTVHYIREDKRIQERWMTIGDLEQSLRSDEEWLQWALQGEVLIDRDAFLEGMRKALLQSPQRAKERRLLSEFSQYLECYRQCKQYLFNGELLDAYTCVVDTLRHWARIIVLEDGKHPEFLVWRQVHEINPGIFKLYEESTQSGETLEQRVKLVLLACDFSVMSKASQCCRLLLRVMGARSEPWRIFEFEEHRDIKGLKLNMPLIMKKLVAHSLIKEETVYNDRLSVDELYYSKV